MPPRSGSHRPVWMPPARRYMIDVVRRAAAAPTVPVERVMDLSAVADARMTAADRPGWPAVFLRAYSRVVAATPALRRAWVGLLRPHVREYAGVSASLAVERDVNGEPVVFLARVGDPDRLSVGELHAAVRRYATAPLGEVGAFRRQTALGRLPGPLRRLVVGYGLAAPAQRVRLVGTFGLTVYSSLGAESLHPLGPLTTTLTYGVIGADGRARVRLVYDHRAVDGATVARALAALEAELCGGVLTELRAAAGVGRRAA